MVRAGAGVEVWSDMPSGSCSWTGSSSMWTRHSERSGRDDVITAGRSAGKHPTRIGNVQAAADGRARFGRVSDGARRKWVGTWKRSRLGWSSSSLLDRHGCECRG
jgi:hypothetical protein